MISLLHGKVAARESASIVVDCGGVGYQVWVSAQTMTEVPTEGEAILLHTHLVLRDDSMTLYGFATVG